MGISNQFFSANIITKHKTNCSDQRTFLNNDLWKISCHDKSQLLKVKLDEMDKLHVSKNPTLEIISETEPHSYNAQRANYHSHNVTQVHVQLPDSRIYHKSTNRIQSRSIDGQINQGYVGNSQNSINRDSSTPSVGGYVTYRSLPEMIFIQQ